MSKQANHSVNAAGEPMMSKTERRAAGKLAAQRRVAAKRRKKAMQNASVALAGIAVVVVLVIIFGGFGSDDPQVSADTQTSAPATQTSAPATGAPGTPPATAPPPSAVPDNLDAALRTKPVVAKPSGTVTELKVTTIVKGKGPAVQNGQTLSVNYVGVRFATGEEFDASWNGGQPLSFPIGQNRVIKGWDEGLVGVTVGSRVQLDIPAEKAYGDPAPQGYPAGALRFVVDILSAS